MGKATFRRVLSMVALAALTACGGGGGSSEAPATVTVAGTAAKGLLANAQVSVYEIGPTGPDYSKPLATGITHDDGSYLLNIRRTNNPILVKIESIAGKTKMLDETQIVKGEYKPVDVPVGLVLRSIAPNANSNLDVSANPFTDAAVAAAETAMGGAWSADAIAGGIQLANQLVPAGVDPFKTKATNLAQAKEQAQQDLLVALTGFMKKAQSCVDDGPTVTLKHIQCEQKKLKALTGLTVTAAGPFMLTKATELAEYRSVQYDEARAATNGTPLQAQANTIAASYGTGGTSTRIDAVLDKASTLEAKSSLKSFVETLRQGFVQSEQTLRQAADGFDARYQGMASDGAGAVIDAAHILNECTFDNSKTFVCGMGWLPASGGGFTKTVPSNRVFGAFVTVTAGASSNGSVASMSYQAQQTKDGKTLSSADLTVGMTGLDTMQSATAAVNAGMTVSGTFRAYDTGPSGAYATLSFDNIRFSAVEGTSHVVKASGGVTLSSSLGDKLAGTLDLEAKEKALGDFDTTGELTKLVLSLKAEAAPSPATQYATLGIVANASPKDFFGLRFDSYSLAANVELTNLTKLGLNVNRAAPNVVNATATIGSNGSVVILSVKADSVSVPGVATGAYCFPADDGAKLCGNELKISTKDGAYTAVLKKGASSGDILSNGVKVGTISRSGVKVDGQEYSFY